MSQPRINRFALQSQNAKDGFMHPAQRFFPNESLEGFDAECEFAKSTRTFRRHAARTQTVEILRRRVFRTVCVRAAFPRNVPWLFANSRSEEHTPELQS